MASVNPILNAYPIPPRPVSKKTYCIAGILTTVYGLDEIRHHVKSVACLWLLHPRLQTQSSMEPVAFSAINALNSSFTGSGPGLIAVTFDQRNHGSRKLDDLRNQDWRSGNPTHAQDMFASYHGTAVDTSHLLTYISAYIFPHAERSIVQNLVCGISLGGHAAWHCILNDPRITTAIVIIGCPDYAHMMLDRARLTKLPTYTRTNPPGSSFIGSTDFPQSLAEAVAKYDPAGFLSRSVANDSDFYEREPTDHEITELSPRMKSSFQHKRILNLAGRDDKLVPYRCVGPFVQWLKRAIAPNSWFNDHGLTIEDMVFEGVGHALSPDMTKEIDRFVLEALLSSPPAMQSNASKI